MLGGVRLDEFVFQVTIVCNYLFVAFEHFMSYSVINFMRVIWHQDCCQYHPAKDGDGWVEKTFEKVFHFSFQGESYID